MKVCRSEHEEQTFVLSWCKVNEHRWPELALIYHVPNEGKRSAQTAAMMRAEGLKSGVPDLVLPVARHGYHGLYIEMKSEKGRATDKQKWWLSELSKQGYKAIICHGGDEAVMAITAYMTN